MSARERYMKHCLCIGLLAIALCSCSSPLLAGRGSSLAFVLGGVLPRTASAENPNPSGSRLVSPETATVRLRASGEGVEAESTTAYAGPGTRALLGGLPVGRPLSVSVDALDALGQPISSWTGSLTLAAGVNELAARLLPPAGSVLSTAANLANLAPINLLKGMVTFYRIVFDAASAPNIVNEYQLIANTHSFRSMWLEAYDEGWNPLPTVARDQAAGWLVVSVPQGGATVYVAVSAPSGDRSATLQARRAVFYGNSVAGTGISASPYADSAFSDATLTSGMSYFLAGGRDYPLSTLRDVPADFCLYGGFLPGNWNARNFSAATDSRIYVAGGTDTAIDISGSDTGFLDGLTVQARDDQAPGSPGDRAVNVVSSGSVVLRDCTLLGPANRLNTNTGARSKALSVEGGTPQIIRCRIEGGNGMGGIGESGITVSGGRPFIYDCLVSGGRTYSPAATTTTVGLDIATGASAVVAGCSVYGGSSTTTASSAASAYSFGVKIGANPSAPVIIANSVISGGYSAGTVSSCPGIGYGIYSDAANATYYPLVANCTIDAGKAVQTGSYSTIASIYSSADAGYISASGNVLLVSSAAPTGLMLRIGAQNFVRFAGNAAFGPLGQAICYRVGTAGASLLDAPVLINSPDYLPYSNASYAGNATYLSAPPASAAFTRIDMSGLTGAVGDFSSWLSGNDWRPSAAMAAYFAGSYNPITSGDISFADRNAYPELGLDRSGRQRPAAGPWARGALEP